MKKNKVESRVLWGMKFRDILMRLFYEVNQHKILPIDAIEDIEEIVEERFNSNL